MPNEGQSLSKKNPAVIAATLILFSLSTQAESKMPNGMADGFSFHRHDGNRYVLYPDMGSARWLENTVNWWYNPTGEPFDTNEVVSAISTATSYWENVCGIKFEYQGVTDQSLSNTDDEKFVIGWLSQSEMIDRFGDYSGYANAWWSGATVYDAEISLVNGGRYSVQTTSELIGLVAHELGHVIGIDHSDVYESIMYANPYHTFTYQQTLRGDDIRACQALYPSILEKNFEIANQGDAILSITEIKPSNNESWITVSPTSFSLEPGSSKEISVVINLSDAPTYSVNTRLLIYSNDPDESLYPDGVYIKLSSTGGIGGLSDSDFDGIPNDWDTTPLTKNENLCTEDDQVLSSSLPSNQTIMSCRAKGSITLEADLEIPQGITAAFIAPVIRMLPNTKIKSGSRIRLAPPTHNSIGTYGTY